MRSLRLLTNHFRSLLWELVRLISNRWSNLTAMSHRSIPTVWGNIETEISFNLCHLGSYRPTQWDWREKFWLRSPSKWQTTLSKNASSQTRWKWPTGKPSWLEIRWGIKWPSWWKSQIISLISGSKCWSRDAPVWAWTLTKYWHSSTRLASLRKIPLG